MWLAVGLAGVVLALVGLALFLWRYGVSEHDEEMREDRRIERLLFRLLEGQIDVLRAQQDTNILLAELVKGKGPVADAVQIAFTPPA